jgi:hypothetical protein
VTTEFYASRLPVPLHMASEYDQYAPVDGADP